ncbi:GNAT family N-acetyltransferase [Kurthia massiliensis]|uniref:GNAT family N-acetyltransferase n=1 Tax=Kurthia massiliensis TaxID=1033739 RepID=UPI0002894A5C|nr:GNAT family N-acetyltransferase [Kurthia massiliensis]
MSFYPVVVQTTVDLERAFSIRKTVFVAEQNVPLDEEIDEFDVLDGRCTHLLMSNEDDEAVGTGRVRLVGEYGKLQRVAVLKPYRSFGIGRMIITALERIAAERGATKTKLDAQVHAIGFYEKLGYVVSSDVFLDAGIEHVLMVKTL